MANDIYISVESQHLNKRIFEAYSFGVRLNKTHQLHISPITINNVNQNKKQGYLSDLVDALMWLKKNKQTKNFNIFVSHSGLNKEKITSDKAKKLLADFDNVHFINVTGQQSKTLSKLDQRTNNRLNEYMQKRKRFEEKSHELAKKSEQLKSKAHQPQTTTTTDNNQVHQFKSKPVSKPVPHPHTVDLSGVKQQLSYQTGALQSLTIAISHVANIKLPKRSQDLITQNRKLQHMNANANGRLIALMNIIKRNWVTYKDISKWLSQYDRVGLTSDVFHFLISHNYISSKKTNKGYKVNLKLKHHLF